MDPYYAPRGGYGAAVDPAYWRGPADPSYPGGFGNGYQNDWYPRPNYHQPQPQLQAQPQPYPNDQPFGNYGSLGQSPSGVQELATSPNTRAWNGNVNNNPYYGGGAYYPYSYYPGQQTNGWGYNPGYSYGWPQQQPQQQPYVWPQQPVWAQPTPSQWTYPRDAKEDANDDDQPVKEVVSNALNSWTSGEPTWRRSYTPLPGQSGCYNRCRPRCGFQSNGPPTFGCKPTCSAACGLRPSCGRFGSVGWAGNTMVCGRPNYSNNWNAGAWNGGWNSGAAYQQPLLVTQQQQQMMSDQQRAAEEDSDAEA